MREKLGDCPVDANFEVAAAAGSQWEKGQLSNTPIGSNRANKFHDAVSRQPLFPSRNSGIRTSDAPEVIRWLGARDERSKWPPKAQPTSNAWSFS
jgi:hypothetical protein